MRMINEKVNEIKNDEVYIINVSIVGKKKNRYYVETSDDNYYFDEDIIVKYVILKGKIFKEKEFKDILKKAKVSEAFNKSIKYLSKSKKSTFEVKEYLRKKNLYNDPFDDYTIEECIKLLKEYNYINDYDYAVSFLNTYKNNKGPNYIKEKLVNKRIHQDIINEVMKMLDNEEEKAMNIALKIKNVEGFNKQPILKQKTKIYNKLISLGFDSSLSQLVLSRLEYEDDSSETLKKDFEKLKAKYGFNKDYETEQKIKASLIRKGYNYKDIEKLMK